MEQPPACLAIQGLIRPAFVEEHSTIQKHLNQSSNTDTSKPIESKGEHFDMINGDVHNLGPLKDDAEQMEKNENSDIPINETTFYKLEMIKIQLFSAAHGVPVCVSTWKERILHFIFSDTGALLRILLLFQLVNFCLSTNGQMTYVM